MVIAVKLTQLHFSCILLIKAKIQREGARQGMDTYFTYSRAAMHWRPLSNRLSYVVCVVLSSNSPEN